MHVVAQVRADPQIPRERPVALVRVQPGERERRFRRRAFERARDQALIALAMKPGLWLAVRGAPLKAVEVGAVS